MKQIALFFYCLPFDNNVFETSIKTLRKSNQDVDIIVFTDCINDNLFCRLNILYHANIININSSLNKRMQTKIIETFSYIKNNIDDINYIAIFDGDNYFTGDPFQVFNEKIFDIGITQKHYWHYHPLVLNAIYINCKNKNNIIQFIDFLLDAITEINWQPLIDYMNKWNHGIQKDWWIDQDLFCVLWESKDKYIKIPYDLEMIDVGIRYNYNLKHLSEIKGSQRMLEAISNNESLVYHLRGRLKDLIYDEIIPDAVTFHPKPDFSDWAQKK